MVMISSLYDLHLI